MTTVAVIGGAILLFALVLAALRFNDRGNQTAYAVVPLRDTHPSAGAGFAGSGHLLSMEERAEAERKQAYEAWADGLPYAMQHGAGGPPEPELRFVSNPPSIHMVLRWWGDWRVRVRVTTPAGAVSTKVLTGSRYMQSVNFLTNYPFTDTDRLEAGTYVFELLRVLEDGQPWEEVLARLEFAVTQVMLDEGPDAP